MRARLASPCCLQTAKLWKNNNDDEPCSGIKLDAKKKAGLFSRMSVSDLFTGRWEKAEAFKQTAVWKGATILSFELMVMAVLTHAPASRKPRGR